MSEWTIADIDQARTVEPYSEADANQAAQEAREAEDLITALEHRVVQGDDTVTAEQIEGQRSLSRFAKLRAQAAKRKADRARAAARLKACDALRAEIEGYASGSGERFAELLRDVASATRAFLTAIDERNARVHDWGERMRDLGVPEHTNPTIPPATHAHLGYHGPEVIAGRRRLDTTLPTDWVSRLLTVELHGRPPGTGATVAAPGSYMDPRADVCAELALLDAPTPDPDPNLVFYRGPAGQVMAYDPDKAPDADDVKRLALTKLSRKEAWGA